MNIPFQIIEATYATEPVRMYYLEYDVIIKHVFYTVHHVLCLWLRQLKRLSRRLEQRTKLGELGNRGKLFRIDFLSRSDHSWLIWRRFCFAWNVQLVLSEWLRSSIKEVCWVYKASSPKQRNKLHILQNSAVRFFLHSVALP